MFIAPLKPWLRWLLGPVLVVAYALHALLGTLTGLLITSLAIYIAAPDLLGVQPLPPERLLLWFDELGSEAKVGLASSLVTVLGFFIALQTTMHSWRKQTAASLRIAAADSIDRVITETNALILKIQVFTEALAREVARVRSEREPLQSAAVLSPLSDDVLKFRANRQHLLELEQEVLALPGRYAVLFLPLSRVPNSLEAIGDRVAEVSSKVWVAMPAGGTHHPDHRRFLVEQVDPKMVAELAQVCEAAHSSIATLNGGVRGALLSPMLELNALTFIRTVRSLFGRGDA